MTATASAVDAAWASLAGLLVAATVASHLRRAGLVRLSVLARRAHSVPALSVGLLLGWAWLGWHFFAR